MAKKAYYTDLSFLKGQTVIDDKNYSDFVKPETPDGCSTSGFKARIAPFCGFDGATAFPSDMILSRQEIKEYVEEQDRNESSLWHVLKRGPKIWKNQNPSSYCWFYATFHALQACRIFANLPVVDLSPLSGSPCDGYSNNGGYGTQANNWLIKYGVCEERLWPSTDPTRSGGINRRYYTEEAKQNALNYRVAEYWDHESRNFLSKASAVVRHVPTSSGYNFLGHQMMTCRIVINENGSLGCIDLDSYGRGGDFSIHALSESRGAADDMVSPRVAT